MIELSDEETEEGKSDRPSPRRGERRSHRREVKTLLPFPSFPPQLPPMNDSVDRSIPIDEIPGSREK